MTEKEIFEEKCMDVIEKVVSIDINQNRLGAVEISRKMHEKAKMKGNEKVIKIYERVLVEFEMCSDEEYELLRKKIFS